MVRVQVDCAEGPGFEAFSHTFLLAFDLCTQHLMGAWRKNGYQKDYLPALVQDNISLTMCYPMIVSSMGLNVCLKNPKWDPFCPHGTCYTAPFFPVYDFGCIILLFKSQKTSQSACVQNVLKLSKTDARKKRCGLE